jgi:hypothetical protein
MVLTEPLVQRVGSYGTSGILAQVPGNVSCSRPERAEEDRQDPRLAEWCWGGRQPEGGSHGYP